MAARDFLDSNILLYQLDRSDGRKHAIADACVSRAVATGSGCISFQVVQECFNAALRKAQVRLSVELARRWRDVVLLPLMQVPPNVQLFEDALALHQRWQFSFYDALIVAAAQQAGCTRLLTEDLQHGQSVAGLLIENPFL